MKKAHIKGLAALLASAILLTSPVYSNQTTDSTVKSYEDQLAYVGQMLEQTLAELESLRANPPKRVAIIVGPEGGFSPEEAEKAEKAGASLLGLGKRILRTESAAAFVLACFSSEFELR